MSTSYDDMMHQASHLDHDLHNKLDNPHSYEAKRLQAKMHEFKEMTQGNHSDPRHVADKARDLREHFHRVEHLPNGQQIMNSGQARTYRDQFSKIYETSRYLHHY